MIFQNRLVPFCKLKVFLCNQSIANSNVYDLGMRNFQFLFGDFGIPFGDMVHLHTVGRFWGLTCMICQVDVNARYFGTVIFYHKYRGYGLLGRDLNTSRRPYSLKRLLSGWQ